MVNGDNLSIDGKRQSEPIKVLYLFDELPTIPEVEATEKIREQRLDMMVEGLRKALGVTTFVEVSPDDVYHGVSFFLRRTHLEAAVIIQPYADKDTQFDYDEVIHEYRSRDSVDAVLRRVTDDFPTPKIFSFDFDSSSMLMETVMDHIKAMLFFVSDVDVILLSNHSQLQLFEWSRVDSTDFLSEISSTLEWLMPDWQMYRCAERLVLKSPQLRAPPPLYVPPLPVCQVRRPIVVDVFVVTRNRPMQVTRVKEFSVSFCLCCFSFKNIEFTRHSCSTLHASSTTQGLFPEQIKDYYFVWDFGLRDKIWRDRDCIVCKINSLTYLLSFCLLSLVLCSCFLLKPTTGAWK